jgi:hypothetical protein
MIAAHRLWVALSIGVISVIALPSCERKEHPQNSETVLTGARIESRDYVAGRLADARCERESTCMDIGPGKRFSSQQVCLSALRTDSLGHLARTDCPNGTDPRGLEKCLGAIRGEVCPHAMDQVDHLAACRAESLCFRPSTP